MINPAEAYVQKSAEILRFISISTLIFGFGSVYFQTINGSGNTHVTFLIEVISVVIYLISSYILIKVIKLDIFWIWSVEYIYFGIMALLSIGYLRLFDWKKKNLWYIVNDYWLWFFDCMNIMIPTLNHANHLIILIIIFALIYWFNDYYDSHSKSCQSFNHTNHNFCFDLLIQWLLWFPL